jgi:hypothetical protein
LSLDVSVSAQETAMKKTFKWVCRICCYIVLAAILLGAFEVAYLNEPKATLLGCKVGEIGTLHCGDGALKVGKEIALNLPFGFIMAPLFALNPPPMTAFVGVPDTWWSAYPFLVYMHHPLFIYLYTLDLILVLAIVHVLRMTISFVRRRWKAE